MNIIQLDKNIFCEFLFKKKRQECYPYEYEFTEFIKIYSKKYSIDELNTFLKKIKEQYIENNIMMKKNQNLYLYNYVSCGNANKFIKMNLDKTQTFEHLFFDQKETLLSDIKNFMNIDHYKKFGMKRKLGYLFVGQPGCGKTSIITAIANELKRSVKNVPISLVKTNANFEQVSGILNIDNDMVRPDEIILTFDEIDALDNSQNLLKKINTEKSSEDIKNNQKQNQIPTIIINNKSSDNSDDSTDSTNSINANNDNLNIGILLSKIDGNEEQEGYVIVATANDISDLDPSIYRNGRLKLIKLKYAGREEISQMIMKYTELEITPEQKSNIRNDCVIQTLNIKHFIAKYLLENNFVLNSSSINTIIDSINSM